MPAVYHATLKHVSLDNVLYDRNTQNCEFMDACVKATILINQYTMS